MNYFNYFTEIEETFIRRRGKHLMLSPLDWAMVEAWKERGIPVRIAVRAIEAVFDRVDKQPNKARSIKSLSYCRDEVEAQYEEWLSARVGKSSEEQGENASEPEESGAFSEEKIEELLLNLCESLAAANAGKDLRRVLDQISSKLEELKESGTDSESLEKSLSSLESIIDKALLEDTDTELLDDIKNKVEENLAEYRAKMEKDVYERTFELMLLKNLRDEANIPRLSLFQL